MQQGIPGIFCAVCLMAICGLLVTADCSLAQGRADHGLRFDLKGHEGEVTSVAVSSDDRMIVTGGMDGRIRMWDIIDGKELYVFGENKEVADVVFSPDNKRVLAAVVNDDNEFVLQIWDYRKQKLRKTFDGYDQQINSIAYSPDGELIASGSGDGSVWIRKAGNGRNVRKYEIEKNSVLAVSWSSDGAYLAGGVSWDGDVLLWDVTKDRPGKTLKGHSDWVNDVLYSPNGRTIISGSKDGSVRIWDVGAGLEKSNAREWWWGEINALAIDRTGTYLAGASEKAGVVVWHAEDGRLLDVLGGHIGKVNAVAFSADGNSLVSGGSDGAVKVWITPGTGSPESVFELAVAHDDGIGHFKENKEEAYLWYLKAAEELGYPRAMARLGEMLADGDGVDQDQKMALTWLQKAAGRGDGEALYILGNMYAVGKGVKLDNDKSVEFWSKAAEFGHVGAKKRLSKRTDGILLDLIDKDSIAWVQKTAAGGDVEAQYSLGLIYRDGGKGIPKSWTKAVKWFKKAAKQGHAEAQFYTAESYKTGKGSPKLLKNAMKWYLKAAELGHVEAQYCTGLGYANGDGVARDYHEAAEWFEKAVGQGNLKASYRLGILFCIGKGVKQDYAKAADLWKKGSQNGDPMATFFLAYMYETGSGVKRDLKQARKLYATAAKRGNVYAGQVKALSN